MQDRKIIYIPGKNLKPEPDIHRGFLLKCLTTGIDRIDPEVSKQLVADDVFELCAWNYSFYKEYEPRDVEEGWVDLLCETDGPSDADRAELSSLRMRLTRLMYSMADDYIWLRDAFGREHARQMLRGSTEYFENQQDIGNTVRDMLRQKILLAIAQQRRILVVGHSMGSIIAFDTLWELSRVQNVSSTIDMFITLGSPLCLHYTQDRLLGRSRSDADRYPTNIRRWENVAARSDMVSIHRKLSRHYRAMTELNLTEYIRDQCKGVFNWYRDANGLNPHRSYGYLVNPVVGQLIVDWWHET